MDRRLLGLPRNERVGGTCPGAAHPLRCDYRSSPSPYVPDPSRDLRPVRKLRKAVTAIRKLQTAAYNAIVTIGRIVRESGLKWTIVRFPLLSGGSRSASLNVRNVGDKGGIRLSRANAAAYYLQQLTDSSQIGRAPFITDK